MSTSEKTIILLWPGVVALAYALLALDGIWRIAMLNSIVITYIAIAPLIWISYKQDKCTDQAAAKEGAQES